MTLIIKASDRHVVEVELQDILACISDGKLYNWKIYNIWIVGKNNSNLNVLNFEEMVNKSPDGYQMKWDGLFNFSKDIFQTIDMTLIGSQDATKLKKYNNSEEMYSACDIVIEMIDSSYWLITSGNAEFILKLKKNIKGIEKLGRFE